MEGQQGVGGRGEGSRGWGVDRWSCAVRSIQVVWVRGFEGSGLARGVRLRGALMVVPRLLGRQADRWHGHDAAVRYCSCAAAAGSGTQQAWRHEDVRGRGHGGRAAVGAAGGARGGRGGARQQAAWSVLRLGCS